MLFVKKNYENWGSLGIKTIIVFVIVILFYLLLENMEQRREQEEKKKKIFNMLTSLKGKSSWEINTVIKNIAEFADKDMIF